MFTMMADALTTMLSEEEGDASSFDAMAMKPMLKSTEWLSRSSDCTKN
jgi:hypothetical protein